MTTIDKCGQASWMRRWAVFAVVALGSLAAVNTAFAQSVSSGTIEGTVKDESNAVLPGVTVTVTSPSLQVGQLIQVSDSEGSYKFVDLPAGTYRLRADLAGFSAVIREDLRLTVGFNARIDLTLKLGADGGIDHRQRPESGRRRLEHDRQRRLHEGSARLDSARPRPAERLCDGPGCHAGGRRRRRQHHGAAPEPLQLRRPLPAEAPGRRHEHHDGRRPEHRHLLQRQHARRSADQDVGQRRRSVRAGHLDGGDHEVGRQRLSRHLPGRRTDPETPGRQPER